MILSSPAEGDREETRGRPQHVPSTQTREEVSKMVAYRLKHEVISDILGIAPKTLRKHYDHELKTGRAKVVVQVANSLLEKAISDRPDAVNAAKFILGSEDGWAEKSEISGPGGGPIETKETGGRDIARRIAFALMTGMAAKGEDDETPTDDEADDDGSA